jgi:rfaE bifunctional protein nucleotidyltransferase chain/domain
MATRISVPEAEALTRRLKRAGKAVVFANGCFDLLHVGHIRYLNAAKRLGDVLVVGVNSDRSARRLKGVGRPLMDEDERAEIISALGSVDYVVVFDGDTADRLIEQLRPDVHAKGTDYTPDSVPEQSTVSSIGGKVVIAGDPKAHSTHDLIATIVERFGNVHP